LLIGGVVAVVVLVGGGTYLATRGDGDSSGSPSTDIDTTETPATDIDTTEAPSPTTVLVTIPPTTLPPPTTTALTTTTAPVSGGVVDLGLGVSMPIPDGWTLLEEGEAPTISDGTSNLTLQALARPAGEDPAVLMQEYINTFDTDYDAVTYDPSVRFPRIEGALAIDQYGVNYRLFDPESENGIGVIGTSYVYVRADGLSVVYDIFSREVTPGPGQASFDAFIDSLIAAPPLGAAAPLTERAPFRVTSVHETVSVFELAGYTLAPSFDVSTQADGDVVATTGEEDFEVERLVGVGTGEAAIAAAQAHITEVYGNVTFEAPENLGAGDDGITRTDVRWATGAAATGGALTGVFTTYFDPATGNAYAVYRGWLGAQAAPNQIEASFMFLSFSSSFTSI
jgi:hypothetical protein